MIDGRSVGVQLADIRARSTTTCCARSARAHRAARRLPGQGRLSEPDPGPLRHPGSNSSIGHRLSELGAAFEPSASAPDSPATRSFAVDTAQRIAGQLNNLTDNLQQMRADADQQISDGRPTINGLLTDIST